MSSTDDLPSRAQLLQAAVLASFTGKAFEDVKFFAFSRRTRNGIVDQPKFLVANSSLVRKATSHFDPGKPPLCLALRATGYTHTLAVLSGGFSESDLIDMDALYPSTLQQGVDDYGYTADSDLESEDEEDLQGGPDSTRPLDPNQILAVLEHATASVRGTVKPRHWDATTSKIPSITGTVSPDLQKIVGRVIEQLQHLSEAHTVKTCLPAGDVDGSTPVEGPDIARPDCNGGVTPTPDVATVISASLEEVSSGSQPKRRGRVIYLHDIAFKTWRAFLFYAYFDELSFAPLKSLKGSTVRISTNDPYGPPLCSPKSMYRLAEKYDIPALKQCARDDIRTQLSQSNILEEVFSSFTTLHPEIQELELDYLYDNIDSPSIQRELPEWIEAMEDGRLSKGTSRTLSSLFTKLVMGSADRRPRSQSNLGSPDGRQAVRTRPACYGPHRAPRVINIEPDGTHICNYCGGEVRAN